MGKVQRLSRKRVGPSGPKCAAQQMKQRSLQERFEAKVNKIESETFWGGTRCHEWSGHIMQNGYGQISRNKKTSYAHRVSWELKNGPIKNGLYVLHRCDNRKCVNPDHLFLGTFHENMDDMVAKKRQAAGMKCFHAKITDDDVRAIRASNLKQQELAEIYGIQQPTISMIKSSKIWRFVEKI